MAAISEEFVISQDQGLKKSSSAGSTLSFSNGTILDKRSHPHPHHSGSSGKSSPTKSVKSERRPSFSITLPPSFSRNSHLSSKSLVFNTIAGPDDDNDSTAGFEDALAMREAASEAEAAAAAGINQNISNHPGFNGLSPPMRRRSVQFIPGEDDSLNRHEGKHGLPKTPYPTTGQEEERIQSSLFLQ
ncbi:hypothetical protein KVV02_006277 [Mortierella alpina]|uniref:Uncharacterized protein n=1 Tax=Mortierella alpina TaxID=64518 RepID=A0A9P8A745_MORAP|nr:hypothetical protein KVV02_006277 [Mortierella alpina]